MEAAAIFVPVTVAPFLELVFYSPYDHIYSWTESSLIWPPSGFGDIIIITGWSHGFMFLPSMGSAVNHDVPAPFLIK